MNARWVYRVLAAATLALMAGTSAVAAADAHNAPAMQVSKNGSRPSVKGPAHWFTGTVRIDPLFDSRPPGRTNGATVTFEPGARSHWHRHPLGQALLVTSGLGYVQSWGGPVRVIRPGDVVSCPANEKHWHGAAPTTAMTHIAVQEGLNGKVVEWLEAVSDEQYEAGKEAVD